MQWRAGVPTPPPRFAGHLLKFVDCYCLTCVPVRRHSVLQNINYAYRRTLRGAMDSRIASETKHRKKLNPPSSSHHVCFFSLTNTLDANFQFRNRHFLAFSHTSHPSG